ncbi:MAG: hypothetical protein LBQ12_09195 [Deltaproteobacteria bacterium]|jgi:hypothetical protein|nr:hypothetical protein [Deltaproteobacteria bacterium]
MTRRPTPDGPPLPSVLSLAATLAAVLALSLALPTPEQAFAALDPSIFEGQEPLTQKDVPAALDALREMTKDNPDPQALMMIALSHSITPQRLSFISAKFMTGLALLMPEGPSREDMAREAGTPLAVPDDSELEVIRGVQDELLEIISQ